MKLTRSAAAFGAAALLAGAAAGCGSSGSGGSSASAAPAKLVVWRMGSAVPSQVTWMNGVVAQFHQKFPQYAKTKVVVDWIPWTSRVTDWTNALTSGKGGPDITELGNTDTPGIASQGALADITSDVKAWSYGSGIIPGNLANDTVNGQTYAVPWFGGVRGIWYRKDEFAKAGHHRGPHHLGRAGQRRQGAGEEVSPAPSAWARPATTPTPSSASSGARAARWPRRAAASGPPRWTRRQSEAGIKFYADLYLTQHVSPSKYIGQTELGAPGATSGGSNEDFALGKLDMYIDGPWAQSELTAVSKKYQADWASFPIPSENGPEPGPGLLRRLRPRRLGQEQVPAGRLGSRLADGQPRQRDHVRQRPGLLPAVHRRSCKGGAYAGNPVMAGFAKAAAYTQIAPLNSKNWATADATDAIIPTLMKSLMQGRELQRDRGQGQHGAAERAQHRVRDRLSTRAVPAGGPHPP